MPNGIEKVSMKEILTYEEILHIVEESVKLGIKHIKITGGEPLVRIGCPDLIKRIKKIPGIETVTLTTNGILLKKYYEALVESGVDGINVSLDTLKPELYEKITGKDCLQEVLEGLYLFEQTNIRLKINVVSLQTEENNLIELVEIARNHKIDVRFIEVMPIGFGKEFETISHTDLFEQLKERYHLIKDETRHGFGPAVYYTIPGFMGSIGFISAMHAKFCESCNRVRLTSTGDLKPCLCYQTKVNLKHETKILETLETCIFNKPKAHCFEDVSQISEDKKMVSIGG